ncbi:hypothetical protein [Alteromonas sp. a30]|uniref:hypothetical protein n=1 Tax=Alteromonas sp. a30 TaxID=2730917 RepID=UPI002280A852|nr:hypothetical protein [Alteromonas sp. a30]MCY7296791.1 hypothetical protein [Alteromonas sp. a30]
MSVQQNAHYRWLEISGTIQTVMDMSDPHIPVLPHLHGMLLSLYYLDTKPQKMFELGLGGGALQRFFHHHFPTASFCSAELDERVIDYYVKFFADTIEAPESYIVHANAQDIVQHESDIDLLFVDLFSGSAPPDFINDISFYENCFNAINDSGIVVINLLPLGEIQTLDVESLLLKVSGYTPAIFSIPFYKNRILIAAKRRLGRIPFTQKFQQFCEKLDIELMNILQLK